MKHDTPKWRSFAQKYINPWLINWTHQYICEKVHRKKQFVLYIASIVPTMEKVEMPCLHNKVALRCSEEMFRVRDKKWSPIDHSIYSYIENTN